MHLSTDALLLQASLAPPLFLVSVCCGDDAPGVGGPRDDVDPRISHHGQPESFVDGAGIETPRSNLHAV